MKTLARPATDPLLDETIPALVALREHGPAAVLGSCGLPMRSGEVTVLRAHPGRRCTLCVGVGDDRLVVKAYRRFNTDAVDFLTRIADLPFAHPAGPGVPRVGGVSVELACFATPWMPGPPALELLAAGNGARVGELAAEWINAISGIASGRFAELGLDPYGIVEALHDLHHWVETITIADPSLGAEARLLARRLTDDQPTETRSRLVHRSFSVSHIIDLGDRPGIVDWDEPAIGPIELDAAAFLASLARQAHQQPWMADASRHAEQRFIEGVLPVVHDHRFRWFRAMTLVKHAKHRSNTQTGGWRSDAAALIDDARRHLA